MNPIPGTIVCPSCSRRPIHEQLPGSQESYLLHHLEQPLLRSFDTNPIVSRWKKSNALRDRLCVGTPFQK